jgi:hypothetical protein
MKNGSEEKIFDRFQWLERYDAKHATAHQEYYDYVE